VQHAAGHVCTIGTAKRDGIADRGNRDLRLHA
jgi:hypothetical protein